MRKIATFDIETTPFVYGVEPHPFLAVIYSLEFTKIFWGDDCIARACSFIERVMGDYRIYAHNGGKFDYVYMLREGFITNPIKVLGGRIAEARVGKAIINDSLLIYPMSLSKHTKDEVDYNNFVESKRENHKDEIIKYCINDCKYLFEIVAGFRANFGHAMTIGQASFRELKKLSKTEKTDKKTDDRFRKFYVGGRCQAFKTGVIKGNYKYYDVNSLYPFAMTFNHFNADNVLRVDRELFNIFDGKLKIGDFPYFAVIDCYKNDNALAKVVDYRLDFTITEGVFLATGYEIQTALKYGLIRIRQVIDCYASLEPRDYSDFVNKYYKLKSKTKDKLTRQFYKLILNSAYGKFGQNANNYFEYFLSDRTLTIDPDYDIYQSLDYCDIYRKPSPENKFNDVSTAASITGKARAIMLELYQHADDLIYTDTDSIMCAGIDKKFIDDKRLGALKLEHDNITTAYIAGKKMYEIYNNDECLGVVCKGIKANVGDVKDLVLNGKLTKKDPVPKFNLGKDTVFDVKTLIFDNLESDIIPASDNIF